MALMISQRNIRQVRVLVWIFTLAAAGVAGWRFTTIFKNWRDGQYVYRSNGLYQKTIESQMGEVEESEFAMPQLTFYAALWTSPFNGFEKPKEPEKTEEVKTENLPTTVEPIENILEVLIVTAKLIDGNPVGGTVNIKYKNEQIVPYSRDEVVLDVGKPLTYPYDSAPYNGKLIGIERAMEKDRESYFAVFQWGDQQVKVRTRNLADGGKPGEHKLVHKGENDFNLTEKEEKSLASHKDSKDSIKVDEDTVLVGADDRDAFMNDSETFLRDAQVVNEPRADGSQHLVIKNPRPNSKLARTYDVQSGDEIISINGEKVSTRSQAIGYVNRNPDLPKYVVEVVRRGKTITKTILVPRDDER